MKTTYSALFRIIPHYSALFRIIPHYSALFRIILIVLTVIPAFSSNGQTSPDNNSDSDTLTISIYSGIGYLNFGATKGLGTELMYNNVSANLGIGKDPGGKGYSIGAKIYNSDANSKTKIFGGINYMEYNYQYDIAITAGYKYTSSNGIYISQDAGVSPLSSIPYIGMNIGYQFKRIHSDLK